MSLGLRITPHATERLQRYFRSVNNKYFGGELRVAAVRFGIPDEVQCNGERRVPPAALYPSSREIVVHQGLPLMNCPRYVYVYLIYHEGLHAVLPAVSGVMHSEAFLKRERFAPHRAKATKWLEKKRFPVVKL